MNDERYLSQDKLQEGSFVVFRLKQLASEMEDAIFNYVHKMDTLTFPPNPNPIDGFSLWFLACHSHKQYPINLKLAHC